MKREARSAIIYGINPRGPYWRLWYEGIQRPVYAQCYSLQELWGCVENAKRIFGVTKTISESDWSELNGWKR